MFLKLTSCENDNVECNDVHMAALSHHWRDYSTDWSTGMVHDVQHIDNTTNLEAAEVNRDGQIAI